MRPGLRAVYGSVDEETAFRESAARTNRLAGRGGARMVSYARITYVIGVKAASHVAGPIRPPSVHRRTDEPASNFATSMFSKEIWSRRPDLNG